MDQNLKQRLVGAIVLISLAVIFLPLVFDGQQQRVNSADYAYPEQPAMTIQAQDFSTLEDEARSVIAQVEQTEARKAAEETRSTETFSAEPDAAPKTPESLPVEDYIAQEQEVDRAIQNAADNRVDLAEAWVIQAGAFSSQENANRLRDKLNDAGYKAYTKAVAGLHKVYVGPEIRRHRLEQQKTALERDFKLNTLILKYIP